MSNLQKAGAWAGMIHALAYMAAMVIMVTLVLPARDAGLEQYVAFVAGNRAVVDLLSFVAYWVSAATLVLMVLALYERLKTAAPTAAQVAAAFGLIWAALIIGSGNLMLRNSGVVAELYAQDPARAAEAWVILEAVENGIVSGNEIVGSLWVVLVSLTAWRTGDLSRVLNVFGVAQMSHQLRSEQLAYEYMLEQFGDAGNKEMVQRLEAAPVTMTDGTPPAYLALRDEAMHSLGIGTTHEMKSVITGVFLPSITSGEYTLMEKINMWRGKAGSGVSRLWDSMLATDLSKQVPELELPVYFFEGAYDYTCSYAEAKAYFETLKAPVKGFYTFEHSAHSPVFEEPARALRILQVDVLAGANGLADPK